MSFFDWIITGIGSVITVTLNTILPTTPPQEIPTTPPTEQVIPVEPTRANNILSEEEENLNSGSRAQTTQIKTSLAETANSKARSTSSATDTAKPNTKGTNTPSATKSTAPTVATTPRPTFATSTTPSGSIAITFAGIASNDIIYRGAPHDVSLTIRDTRTLKKEQNPAFGAYFSVAVELYSQTDKTKLGILLQEAHPSLPPSISLGTVFQNMHTEDLIKGEMAEVKIQATIKQSYSTPLPEEQIKKELAEYTAKYNELMLSGTTTQLMSTSTYEKVLRAKRIKQEEVVASATVDSLKLYAVTENVTDPKTGYYGKEGTILLGEGAFYDAWGGRFLYRLDSLSPERAVLSRFFDKTPLGTVTIPLNAPVDVTITGMDPSNVTNKYKELITVNYPVSLPLTLTYLNFVNKKIGRFTMTQSNIVDSRDTIGADPDGAKITTTKGWATVSATPTGNPREIKVYGMYNVLKSCSYNVSYTLQLPQEQKEMRWKSCDPTPYEYIVKLPSDGAQILVISIDQYRVSGQNWNHFVQESILVDIAADGSVQISPYNIDSPSKG